jgi:hypothetical protein
MLIISLNFQILELRISRSYLQWWKMRFFFPCSFFYIPMDSWILITVLSSCSHWQDQKQSCPVAKKAPRTQILAFKSQPCQRSQGSLEKGLTWVNLRWIWDNSSGQIGQFEHPKEEWLCFVCKAFSEFWIIFLIRLPRNRIPRFKVWLYNTHTCIYVFMCVYIIYIVFSKCF